MTFFVTSVGPGKGGDLGGLAGADAYCQTLRPQLAAAAKTWRAYLSTNAGLLAAGQRPHRIGKRPVEELQGRPWSPRASTSPPVPQQRSRARRRSPRRAPCVNGVGMQPNQHDAMTGSTADGRVFPVNLNLTCNNWSSSTFGSTCSAISTDPQTPANLESWNAAHMSRSCSQPDLVATGGQRPVLLLRA